MAPSASKLVSGPDEEPVSLGEAKLHCRVKHDDEDDWFPTAIRAAREWCEKRTGRAIPEQTRRFRLDRFCGRIEVPTPPLQAVDLIVYVDQDGDEQAIDPADYRVDADAEPGLIEPVNGWPTTAAVAGAVRVTYVAGWPAEEIPAAIKQAMLLLIGHWYLNREDVVTGTISTQIQSSVSDLLAAYWTGRYA